MGRRLARVGSFAGLGGGRNSVSGVAGGPEVILVLAKLGLPMPNRAIIC